MKRISVVLVSILVAACVFPLPSLVPPAFAGETYQQKVQRLNERGVALDRREAALDQLSKHLNNWYGSENLRSRQNDEERALIKAERAAFEAEKAQLRATIPPGEFTPAPAPQVYATPVPQPQVQLVPRTYYYWDISYLGWIAVDILCAPRWVAPPWWYNSVPYGYAPIGRVGARVVNNTVMVNNVQPLSPRIRNNEFDQRVRRDFSTPDGAGFSGRYSNVFRGDPRRMGRDIQVVHPRPELDQQHAGPPRLQPSQKFGQQQPRQQYRPQAAPMMRQPQPQMGRQPQYRGPASGPRVQTRLSGNYQVQPRSR